MIDHFKGFKKTLMMEPQELMLSQKQVIWKKSSVSLWYYPANEKKFHIPLLLVYSLVNEPSIIDLSPELSYISALQNSGFDVYLLKFDRPIYADKDLDLNDYLTKYMDTSITKVLNHSRAKELTIIGFCLGGTLSIIYSSITDQPIKNLILSVSPTDFEVVPVYQTGHKMLQNEALDIGMFLESMGIVPRRFVHLAMRLITSPFYFTPYLTLLAHGDDKERNIKWKKYNQWTKSYLPLGGKVTAELLERLIKNNEFIKGELVLGEKIADPKNITANLLVIASEFDALVPKEQVTTILDFVSSQDKELVVLKGGHTPLCKDAQLPNYLYDWLAPRSHPIN